jgi:hypothetical protein
MGFSRATQSESHRKGRFPGAAWCESGPMIQFPFGFLPCLSAFFRSRNDPSLETTNCRQRFALLGIKLTLSGL